MKDNILALGEVLTEKRPGWTRCCLIMSLMFVMVEFLALGRHVAAVSSCQKATIFME
ncbi:hypothetical protein OESDEN_05732 [Oesophagostomum dentatum]|uniref:Uncharacterized protein n=1 Tax=Oesophagostomum dentatum TaxID=61180 RepID=A0A0B1T9U9_OESDE|nr:hypothetical protein OESDEN_05732 [Oesophagostomum dentatum]